MSESTSFTYRDAHDRPVRRRATRIAFFGFYGRRNFGDDLFCYLLQRLCEHVKTVSPMLVGATRQRELRAAWRFRPFSRWIGRSDRLGTVARFVTYCTALARADVAAFGGGSLFGAHASLAFARLIVGWGAWMRKPVVALGVSVGPFSDRHRRAGFLGAVTKLAALAVRDDASLVAVGDSVVTRPQQLGDIAYALPALYRPTVRGDGMRTLVIAVHLASYVEQVVAILRDAERVNRFDRVRFVALDDACTGVTEAIRERCEPVGMAVDEVSYVDSIESVVDVLASASCIVTSKLHGAITGHVYGVPVLLFCYQRKCADFLDGRNLPGPRTSMPSPDECARVVHEISAGHHGGVRDASCEHAESYRRAFCDFIRRAADLHRR
ncbi:hypothetical protein GWK53_32130 [Burkholderia cepacia]|uniref:polysaccharide pyruvyl transferase family protein n=1 Tax=Burkholderia cepacia TaxID=292 RepID=UPI0013F4664A|nr:hypothetical protein [Burkholderia cepacia]